MYMYRVELKSLDFDNGRNDANGEGALIGWCGVWMYVIWECMCGCMYVCMYV
jgi:hypothetical protein